MNATFGKFSPRALSIFVVLAFASSVAAADLPTKSIAVVDFETVDAPQSSRDISFGLADVLAMELQRRGVVLFERQQIRIVLGERKITSSGLMQLGKTGSREIPALRYLVTGIVRPRTKGQIEVEASLVNARTGGNAASFARQVGEKELPGALSVLAEQIANHLSTEGIVSVAKPTALARPTREPEVNLLFYKGIACCLAGKPELGVSWFIDAQKIDPHFLAARVWTLRAFEMLKLNEFVEVARGKVIEAPGGAEVLNRLTETHLLDQKLMSVAIILDPQLDNSGLQIQTKLKTSLARATNVFLVDASNIRALAAEMDLQLTQQGRSELELASVLWSSVDAFVFLRPASNADDKFISIEVHDALSGEILFSENIPRNGSDVERTALKLAEQVSAHRKSDAKNRIESSGKAETDWPIKSFNNTDRDQFAILLRHASEQPTDKPPLLQLALFSRWLNAGIGGRYDGLYQRAVSERILAATDLKEPDAASWISRALWNRRYYEKPQPIAVQFATLFEHFPNSTEAQYARSALAMELVDEKKYAEASEIFLKLADELPRLSQTVKISPEYWANFYFFTAAALFEAGEMERAKPFFSKADEILQKHPDLNFFQYARGVWVNHFPQSHSLFGKERNLREAVAEWRSRFEGDSPNKKTSVTPRQLETLLAEARAVSGREAVTKCKEFMRQLIEHKQANPELYRGKITDPVASEPWRQIVLRHGSSAGNYTLMGKLVVETIPILNQLALVADSQKELEDVRKLAGVFADQMDATICADIFTAVGEYQKALQQIELAIKNSATSLAPPSLRQQKIGLLQQLGKPLEAAAYAHTQLAQPDPDAKLKATVDAADADIAAGRAEEARRLFAKLIEATGPADSMDNFGASVRLWSAEFEIASGNYFEASEILREVARQSEGKFWGVYLRQGYNLAYEAAVSGLAKLRHLSKNTLGSTDWQRHRRNSFTGVVPERIEQAPSAAERELNEMLLPVEFWGSYSSGGKQAKDFAKKYGRSAVPAIIQSLQRADTIPSALLDQAATIEDAPVVLEAFKKSPRIAGTAFRLDAAKAATILNERFSVYLTEYPIPGELLVVVEKYRLKEQYPVLIANLIADVPNVIRRAVIIERILKNDPDPELTKSFRAALAFSLERQLVAQNPIRFIDLAEAALRNGVSQGIAALFQRRATSPDALVRLRKFIELPADEALAWKAVETNLGRWQWNVATSKFTTQTNEKAAP